MRPVGGNTNTRGNKDPGLRLSRVLPFARGGMNDLAQVFRSLARLLKCRAHHQQRELFAAVSRYNVLWSLFLAQALSNLMEYRVAGQVAPGVVDLFEMIQINKKHYTGRSLSLTVRDLFIQPL